MRQQLIDGIYTAFEGVVLHNGVSLHETAVLDQYGQNQRYIPLREQARNRDELYDWTKLVGKKILRRMAPFALTGLDAIGLRYYTPPCLITILRQELPSDSPIFVPMIRNAPRITEGSDWRLFSLAQLEIIRDCLLHFTPYTDAFLMQDLHNGIETTSLGIKWKTDEPSVARAYWK
jgi:hypothetical protein